MKIITFAHDKGGVGKTTNSINTAVALESRGYKIKVIDLDKKNQLSLFNKNRVNKANKKPLKQVYSKSIEDFKKIVVEEENQNTDILLIDLGGFDSDFFRTALLISDLVIVPLSGSGNDLAGIKDFASNIIFPLLKEIKSKGRSVDISILVNRVNHNDKITHQILSSYEKYGLGIYNTIIRDRTIYGDSILTGKAITELTVGSPTININSFVDELELKIRG